MFRSFLCVWFEIFRLTGSFLIPFPPFALSLEAVLFLRHPPDWSFRLAPAVNAMPVIHSLLSKTEIVLAYALLSLTSSSCRKGNQITSLQSTPLVDINQQRDCDFFFSFFDNLVMEVAMESLTRMQYTPKSSHS